MPPGNPQGYQQQQGLPRFREPAPYSKPMQGQQNPFNQQRSGNIPGRTNIGNPQTFATRNPGGFGGMNPGMGRFPVSPRFNPGGQFPRKVTPPFQNFNKSWGPRTQGFQAPGSPVAVMGAQAARRNMAPQGAAIFPAQTPRSPGSTGRFNKFI